MSDRYKDIIRQTFEIELALARSEFLDAFADIEAEVAGMLKLAGKLKSGCPFHVRIDAFRTIEGISKIAKVNHPKRDALADRLTSLLALRADIVHSRMNTCIVDGAPSGRFVNAQNRHERHPACRLVALSDLRGATRELADILDGLKVLGRVNPAAPSQQLLSQ